MLSNINRVHALPFYVKIHFNIILPRSPGYSRRYFSLKFSNQNYVCLSLLLYACHMSRPSITSNLPCSPKYWAGSRKTRGFPMRYLKNTTNYFPVRIRSLSLVHKQHKVIQLQFLATDCTSGVPREGWGAEPPHPEIPKF